MSAPQIIEIKSFSDPRVDVYRNVRDADMRGRDGLFMAESELVLRRLLRTAHRIHSVLLSREKHLRMRDVLRDLPPTLPVFVADLSLIHQIAAFHVHRGCLAAGYRLPKERLTLDAALDRMKGRAQLCLLAAEGITNVDNMGALFRNAAAFGVDGILLDPTCCDPLYRKAIRVSMGHTLSIPYAVSKDFRGDLRRLREEWKTTLVAAEITPNSQPVWTIPRCEHMTIVVGAEGKGLPPATLEACDAVCAIPMIGDVPSLNVAVASAVFLYERARPQ